ncbi:nuclear transport factor 2 family protein [Defluviimonas sp. WL0024]|uniref:Nuclear transport factor 2 family protein n=1 Tax=Albidovulum salinarum TaxID=2984153 RepID=A0ABT2X769_9RHOB|nr:nuclear transport factor 2 family protein [Defluviimonas sp. WL0024]MCU9849796.1 nuclear transport factor 2 family protein [Defluviimonas sp. WL0024]
MTAILTKPAVLTAVILALAGPVWADDAAMTEEVVHRHLAAFGAGDMDAMLADFTDTSVMIANGTVMTGPEEMRPAFEAFFAEFGKPDVVFEMTGEVYNGRIGYITWHADTPDNTYETGTDTFLVEDGKIVAQTFTAKITPK